MESLRKLAAWIDERGSRAEFAKSVGISEPHLSLVLDGKRGLSLKAAAAIERETKGAFKCAELAAA